MPASPNTPLGCLQLRWRDPSQTAHNVGLAAKLMACGASRRPDRMTDLLLNGPHGALRAEPVEWRRRCWHARVPLRWPAGGDRALWGRVLLAANAELMRHGAMAFAVDGDHMPVLLGRVHAGPESGRERHIAQQLLALLEVCATVESLLRLQGSAPLAYDALAAFIAPRAVDGHATDAEPCSLLDLLLDTGMPQQQACFVAAAGRLPVGDGEVHVETDGGGHALLLSTGLERGLLDGKAIPALRTNARLMHEHGLALVHGADGHQLVAYWPGRGRPAAEFEECLIALAGLPATLQDARMVHDPVDIDFSAGSCLEDLGGW